MGNLTNTSVRRKGEELQQAFDRATDDPATAQKQLLIDILRRNEGTLYGRKYDFPRITDVDAFCRTVPVATFADLAPYVERIKNGENNILTTAQPVRFNVTSGTTAEPKYIPVTQEGMDVVADTSLHWLCRALEDHPDFLDRSIV